MQVADYTGFLGYRPPPETPGAGGTNWWLLGGAAMLAAVAVGAGARLIRRRAP